MGARFLLEHMEPPPAACRRQFGVGLHAVAIDAALSQAGEKLSPSALENCDPPRNSMQFLAVEREAPARAPIGLVPSFRTAVAKLIQPPVMVLHARLNGVQRCHGARGKCVHLAEDPLRVPAKEPSSDMFDEADSAAPQRDAGVDGNME